MKKPDFDEPAPILDDEDEFMAGRPDRAFNEPGGTRPWRQIGS